LRNASAGLFIVLLVVGAEMSAHNSMQSCGVKLRQVSCTTGTDPSACYYSFSLDVTNNTTFTGQASVSGPGLILTSNPNLHSGSGNIINGTFSVPCGTTGVLITVSLQGTSCTVQVPLRPCSCTVTATVKDQTICKGANTQINLPSNPQGTIAWYSSSPCASPIPPTGVVPAGWFPVSGGTSSTVAPTQTTCYQAVVTNMPWCSTGTGVSNLVTVNVVNLSNPGSITCSVVGAGSCPANGEICSGSTVTLFDPNTPGPNCSRQWYQWDNMLSLWQPIGSAQTVMPTLTSPTCPSVPAKFRVVYSCPSCPDTVSEISFKVYSPVQGGTITGAPSICDGMGEVLTLAGECGDVVQWESSPSGLPGTFNAIPGSGGTHTWQTNQIPPHYAYYQVMVRNGACGIAYSPVFHVTLNPKPNPTITAGGPLQFCAPGSVTLNATSPNGGTCTWYRNGLSTNVPGMTYSASASGNYYVVCTDNINNCGTTKSNIIKVKASKPVAVILGPCGVCLPNSVHLSALAGGGVPPYTYLWSTGQTTQSINPSPSTNITYTVTVTDAIGCWTKATHTVTICKKKVVASAGPNVITCPGGQVTIGGSPTASLGSGSYSYSWSPAVGLSSTSIANPTASPSQTTTYWVTVTDASTGCWSRVPVTVTVQGQPCARPRGGNSFSLRLFFGLGSQPDLMDEIPWHALPLVPSANFAARH
jgi:hypothetical protein